MAGRFPYPMAFLWPALAAQSASQIASAIAGELIQLADGKKEGERAEPRWATPNKVVLELPTMRLRKFSAPRGQDVPTLICAPFSLHGAAIADFAPGHSVAERLRQQNVAPLYVTHWRSAAPDMRFFSIDTYFADLNVAIDELGGVVNLIGACQGGWMALAFAARFPAKVRTLVLAGAPVDIAAGESGLSQLAATTPLTVFREIIELGEGRVLGHLARQLWGAAEPTDDGIRAVLQLAETTSAQRGRQLAARFRRWDESTVDLPGPYYLQVVEWLYKENRLAAGQFVALGRRVNLRAVKIPVFLLAARDDEVVAPAQLFAAEGLVATSPRSVRKATVPGGHLALFMGAQTLDQTWPKIAQWIMHPDQGGAVSVAAAEPLHRAKSG